MVVIYQPERIVTTRSSATLQASRQEDCDRLSVVGPDLRRDRQELGKKSCVEYAVIQVVVESSSGCW